MSRADLGNPENRGRVKSCCGGLLDIHADLHAWRPSDSSCQTSMSSVEEEQFEPRAVNVFRHGW